MKKFKLPRKKFRNNWKIWRPSYCSHEENNIWMPQSFHYLDLLQFT